MQAADTDLPPIRPLQPSPSDSPPRVTPDVFTIPLEHDRFLVYAPLARAAFVTNGAGVNVLAALQQGRQAAPSQEAFVEFLTRLELVDAAPGPLPVTVFTGAPKPIAVTLFLTTGCNLRCSYCYARAGETPLRSMPLEVAQRGIDFVAGNADESSERAFEVNYHGGGEPTVNWQVLTGSFAYARQRAADLRLSLSAYAATNGVLRDDQIDWMIANLTGVSVSFDGLPEVHDAHRPLVGGAASSPRVLHTMRRFAASGLPFGVRLTATRDQIPRLEASVRFLCAEVKATRLQVEPAYQLGRWSQAPSAETGDFIAAFRAGKRIADAHGVELTYSAARVDLLTNHFCGVTQDSFALSADGNVSACYEVFAEFNQFADTFFYGMPDPAGGYAFDLARLEHLRHQAVQHQEFCRGCFAKWHCAGDCHHKSLHVNGPGAFTGSDRCHITRELTKDQILERIARAGGVFWHAPAPATESRRAAGKELLS